jgi:tRNA/tmRNA/rRNA uracil-C5-methylase (TrmA/RlmC/RlmD family)
MMTRDLIGSVKVRGLTNHGVGVGRSAKHEKVHIYGAIPGEAGSVALTGEAEGIAYGIPADLSVAHPRRIPAFCPAFEQCLGCPTMPFPAEVQQSLREYLLTRLLSRLSKDSGVVWPDPKWVLPSYPERWAKRVRYRYRTDGKGGVSLGFYRPDRSSIQDLDDCAVAAAPLAALLPHLRASLAQFTLPSTGQIVAAVDDGEDCNEAVLCLRAEDKHFPDPDWCQDLASGDWPVRGLRLIDREYRERFRHGDPEYVLARVDGNPSILKATVGLPLEDDPRVLRASWEILKGWLPASSPCERVLELFAGVGVFTTYLQEIADRVDAVTTPAHALDDLHANFDAFPRDQIQRSYASISRGLGYAYRKKDLYDLVCAWVPLRGAIGLWRTLADVAAPRLITSHASLEKAGPDLRRIVDLGYGADELYAFAAEPNRGRVSLLISWRSQG